MHREASGASGVARKTLHAVDSNRATPHRGGCVRSLCKHHWAKVTALWHTAASTSSWSSWRYDLSVTTLFKCAASTGQRMAPSE